MSSQEEQANCVETAASKDRTLVLTSAFLVSLCRIGTYAAELLEAVIDHKPMAEIVKQLSVALDEAETHGPGGDFGDLEGDFLFPDFVGVELEVRDADSSPEFLLYLQRKR